MSHWGLRLRPGGMQRCRRGPTCQLSRIHSRWFGGNDFYDVSFVDGFNLPLAITPHSLTGCLTTSCSVDINSICPAELCVMWSDTTTISCKSACMAFNSPKYCCTGAYGSPSTCPPTNYSNIFKNACPQAYSYAYDDGTSTFTCATGADYTITFCI
ncbi:hypothetical protein GIB67_017211 [Kingdonia uniflora]|uniref:Thaumatin-like protein n=1 Tax=Kingdonia uniflora TaxID=39325 RepID=A0A7J7NKR0_9MAGN|nr:hypothetical protein GIB67_017211 [Kingdonia uniflora]